MANENAVELLEILRRVADNISLASVKIDIIASIAEEYARLGEFEKARKTALKLDPEPYSSHVKRASVFLEIAKCSGDHRDYEQARRDAQKISVTPELRAQIVAQIDATQKGKPSVRIGRSVADYYRKNVGALRGTTEKKYFEMIYEEISQAQTLSREEAATLMGQWVKDYTSYAYLKYGDRVYIVQRNEVIGLHIVQ